MAKEYIERNALIAEYDRVHIGPPGGARKLMEDAPTADVVEVVRCKDCVKRGTFDCVKSKGDHPTTTKNEEFCCWGERIKEAESEVKCKDCEYLMFSDMYGECSRELRIVRPNDSCGKGKRKGGE